MRRRTYLATVGATLTGAVAGCASGDDGRGEGNADGTEERTEHDEGHSGAPDWVYIPEHATAMTMEGMGGDGDFQFSVMISSPESFFLVEGTDVRESILFDDHSVHVMASVWDPETGVALPETGMSVEILDADGRTVIQEVIYPMLSQRMGLHYGANVALDGYGEYTARVSVGGMEIERTRGFADRFDDPASVDVPVSFTEAKVEKFTESNPADAGEHGALSPMEMGMRPTGALPKTADMPGTALGTTTSDDARLHMGVLTGTALGGDDPYLYVSPRTPYNRFPLPNMLLRAVLHTGDGRRELELTRRLDDDLNYHYGVSLPEAPAVIAGEIGLGIVPSVPPQVTRHAGYETAFVEMDPVTIDPSG